MKLISINKEKFEILNCSEEWTEFKSNGINCKFKLSDLSEIRMSLYLYFDVKFFKGDKLLQSGEMQLPEKYYVPVSPDKKFIYIPFKGGSELINLETEQRIESSVNLFCGNIYNSSSTKMIINGSKEFKVIDLLKMKEIDHVKEGKNYDNDAFFENDNIVWQLKDNNKIEELNLKTKEKKVISIKSPFDKFEIELEKYQLLIEKKTHCLGMPSGGLGYSENLNSWNYVNAKGKLVLETVIPTSEIKYSKEYETDFCHVEYKYVEIKNNTSANNL